MFTHPPYCCTDCNRFNPVFSRTLRTILERHAPVVITIARGLLEMKMKTKAESGDSVDPSTQYFLGMYI